MGIHAPDTEHEVRFYGCDFYCLSNFAAFNLVHGGITFMTSEHAYHWEKFNRELEADLTERARRTLTMIREAIMVAPSAHEALMIARRHETEYRRNDWLDVRVNVMRAILFEKVQQHEYVMRKLMQTGYRKIVEDSWRDAFWGIGPNGDGQNVLGELWMQIRADLR
jgi:ribA/ribD-fused uncharacterized protein